MRISKLKSQLRLKISNQKIIQAYKANITKLERDIQKCRTELGPTVRFPQSTDFNSDSLQQIGEGLLYLSNQNKPAVINSSTIMSLTSTFNSKLQAIALYPVLTQNSEIFKRELDQKLNAFNPEDEFSCFGIKLLKKGVGFELECSDHGSIIDSFSKEAEEKRENCWAEFNKVESILDEISMLKGKFRNLFTNKKFQSTAIKEFCLSEISKSSKKAELHCLQQGISELELKKTEKENQSLLSSHQQQSYSSDSINLIIAQELPHHSQLRREILKKKIQTDEFIKKHVVSLKQSLPETLKPIHTGVSREYQEYLKIAPLLYPSSIPHPPGKTGPESMIPLFSYYTLNPRTLAVFKLIKSGSFFNPIRVIDNFKEAGKIYTENMNWVKCPEIKVDLKIFETADSGSNLKLLKEKIEQIGKEINGLDEEYAIWQAQPGQHVIPWRRDHFDLNISEALEYWKTSIINK